MTSIYAESRDGVMSSEGGQTFVLPLKSHEGSRSSYVWGYDAIRVIAMSCVAVRHIMSIYEYERNRVPVLIGLPAFSALSGYLSLRGRGDALNWFVRRFSRIYASYLIFIVAILATNQIVSYKPVSVALAVAQLLGCAAITHPGELLGIHTWFISFIMVCYGAAFFVRWNRWFLWVFTIVGLAACHFGIPHGALFLTFITGGIVANSRKVGLGSICLIVACVAVYSITGDKSSLCIISGLSCLWLGSNFKGSGFASLNFASKRSYEFYLSHGPIYVFFAKYASMPFVWNLLIGSGVSMVVAHLLHLFASKARKCLPDTLSCSRNDGTKCQVG